MSELQISPAVFAIVGCTFMATASVVSTLVFYKKNDNAENPGSILSIMFGIPFFLSLCYLLWCVMEKIGNSI